MKREKLKNVLTKKIDLMEKLRELLQEKLEAIVTKDFKKLEGVIGRIEEMSFQMEMVNEELKAALNLHSQGLKLVDLLEMYKDDEEMILILKDFFESLNRITFEVEKLKQAIDFHLRYIDLVFGLQRNSVTYRKDGSFDEDGPSTFLGRS
ncbi:flagellar export chaperone FlgN [Thermotoga sp. SG1]|uniref:flagellar export chaperone FlgN n=1 Tax=Thermotoga sp. SG1 TaxID=126739 RepID=UPI000C777BB8|nr:flagellar export chaperone FlgN [Thermotoga sp. SG1]PLV57636.1 flagellar biosynthesis protein FlgN [Thermotoga sp. SG1]